MKADSSFTWNGATYCTKNGKMNKPSKFWKEIFIMGTGWITEKSSSEEFSKLAKIRAEAFK